MIFYDGGMGFRSIMTYDDNSGGGRFKMFVFWLPEYKMYRTDIALGEGNTNRNDTILSADEKYLASTTQTNNIKT